MVVKSILDLMDMSLSKLQESVKNRKTCGETVSDFIFEGSKITAYDDCTNEIKRHLLLGRKSMSMTNLDSILKSRDIILPT